MDKIQVNGQTKYTVKDALEEVQKELESNNKVDLDIPTFEGGVHSHTVTSIGEASGFIMAHFSV